jgi:hypothetical protein
MKLDEFQATGGGEAPQIQSKNLPAILRLMGGDNQKAQLVIQGMRKLQQGQGLPAGKFAEAILSLIQNSVAIEIQSGTAAVQKIDTARNIYKDKDSKADSGDAVPDFKSSAQIKGEPEKLTQSKQYEDIDESMAYAMPGQDEEKETVTYSKTKKQGDSSVTVSANADSMDELHDILRLAGIDFEKSGEVDHTPDHNDHDDHEEEPCDDCDNEEPDAIVVKGMPQDDDKPNYSTDKEVLINYLKDKMSKSV